jgi:hypothetical protein
MPSKLDPHVATIEDWLAAEPQLTALAIVGRLSEKHPEQFETRQHSIVQRLLKALTRNLFGPSRGLRQLGDSIRPQPGAQAVVARGVSVTA